MKSSLAVGTVLGLSRSLRITKETGRSANKALELAPRGKAKRVRYVDPAHAWKAHAASSRRLLPSGEAPDVAGDFVRVSRRAAPVDEEARGGPDYRSLGSGSVAKPPSGAADASDESVSESSGAEDDEAGEDPTAALRANVAVLDARVRANEADIEGWLALARAQAQLARASSALVDEAKKQRSAARVDTGALAKLAAEAQLAVLTKAAKLHPANLRLARARLDIGAQFWERQKVDAEWSRLVDAARLLAAPDVVDVWQSYVTWKASDSGSVAEMVATFAHALKVLRERSWLAQGQTCECTAWVCERPGTDSPSTLSLRSRSLGARPRVDLGARSALPLRRRLPRARFCAHSSTAGAHVLRTSGCTAARRSWLRSCAG